MRLLRFNMIAVVVCATLIATPALATPALTAQDRAAGGGGGVEPSVQDVYVVMRDLDLDYENVQIRTIVANEDGVSALVGLTGGTLVDVVLTPTAIGWTLRDIYYVAGNSEEFNAWTTPWRQRVEDTERFLSAATGEGEQPRPEELAPLIWFEDLDEQRLWGLNPTTYRIMQTLKMMPNLSGPMGGGSGVGR